MEIYNLNENNVLTVAKFMSAICPDFWSFNGALQQLSSVESVISTVGWFIGKDENCPKGWVLCREYTLYKTIELECCGYDNNGNFEMEHKLGMLFDTISEYAKSKGYLTFKTAMGSQEFSIHNRELGDIGDEIKNLTHTTNRADYNWLIEYGFKVIGIQPNAYGDKFHCIILAKDLRE